ncbi:MAG: YitT family protein [Firmicutes bacterium]|nr:YitT family protein [Bacillota bacterium]
MLKLFNRKEGCVVMKKLIKLIDWNFKDIIKMILGSLMFCIAVNVFIVPNSLYTGGVLGISQLIRSVIIDVFGLKVNFDFSGILYYIMNIPLFFIAYKNISKPFFLRTLIVISIQTVMLSLIPTNAVVNDLLTNVLVGGLLGGAGLGIVLSSGASTGGTDIVGLMLAKKNNELSVGKLGLVINIFTFTIAGIMYGIETMIYSIVYSFVDSLTIDKMHEQNICSTAFIFCKKNPKDINNYIKNELNRDFTYWDAKGGYDDSRTYIIYTALSKYELIKLERKIKECDFDAFMVKSDGVGIKGEFEKKF